MGNKKGSRPGPKFLKFFVLLVLGAFNLLVDWFFYTRIELIEPGLIYGPPDKQLKLVVFIFCVISTIGFIVEVVHNIDDLSETRKLRFLTQSVTNFIIIVFTDLPLIILNLIIIACHDGEPTIITTVKSTVCITMFAVRLILMMSYRCCSRRQIHSRFERIIDILATIGLCLVLLISIKIQLICLFPTRSSGGFFPVSDPMKFKTMDFVKSKYLNGVGIFTQWPLQAGNTSGTEHGYLRITDINEVIDETFLRITIKTNQAFYDGNDYTICLIKRNIEECYQMSKDSGYMKKLSTSSKSLGKHHHSELLITKEPAQAYRYLLGYLDYNMKQMTIDQDGTVLECSIHQHLDSVLYGKFLPNAVDLTEWLRPIGDLFSFYNHKTDLQTVDKYWLTGIFGCHMSGDLGPKFNTRILMEC